MNLVELVIAAVGGKILSDLLGGKKTPDALPPPPAPTPPPPPPQTSPPAEKRPPVPLPPYAGVPGASATTSPPIPAAAPASPGDIKWPEHAGIPGAGATVKPTPAPAPGAPPPPPPPIVDEKMPSAQKGAPAVTSAAQKGIDALREQQQKGTGTGKRQFRPKRRGLTRRDIQRAKALVGGWEKGKTWRDGDDPSILYVAAVHPPKKKAIEVWTSNPDYW